MQSEQSLEKANTIPSKLDQFVFEYRGAPDIDRYYSSQFPLGFRPDDARQTQIKQITILIEQLTECTRFYDNCSDKILKTIKANEIQFKQDLLTVLGENIAFSLNTELEAIKTVVIDGLCSYRDHLADQVLEKMQRVCEYCQALTVDAQYQQLQERAASTKIEIADYLLSVRKGIPVQSTLTQCCADLAAVVAKIADENMQIERRHVIASYAKERVALLESASNLYAKGQLESKPEFAQYFGANLWRIAVLGIDLYEHRNSKSTLSHQEHFLTNHLGARNYSELLNSCSEQLGNIQRGELYAVYNSLGIQENLALQIAEMTIEEIAYFPLRRMKLARQLGLSLADIDRQDSRYSFTLLEEWSAELQKTSIDTTMLGAAINVADQEPLNTYTFKLWLETLQGYISSLNQLERLLPSFNYLHKPQLFSRAHLVQERVEEREKLRKSDFSIQEQERVAAAQTIYEILKSEKDFHDIARDIGLILVYGFASESKSKLYDLHNPEKLMSTCLVDSKINNFSQSTHLSATFDFIKTMSRLFKAQVVNAEDSSSKREAYYQLNRSAHRLSESWAMIFRILEALPEGGSEFLVSLNKEALNTSSKQEKQAHKGSKPIALDKMRKLLLKTTSLTDAAGQYVAELLDEPLAPKAAQRLTSQLGSLKSTLEKLTEIVEEGDQRQALADIHRLLADVDKKKLEQHDYTREIKTTIQSLSRILQQLGL